MRPVSAAVVTARGQRKPVVYSAAAFIWSSVILLAIVTMMLAKRQASCACMRVARNRVMSNCCPAARHSLGRPKRYTEPWCGISLTAEKLKRPFVKAKNARGC